MKTKTENSFIVKKDYAEIKLKRWNGEKLKAKIDLKFLNKIKKFHWFAVPDITETRFPVGTGRGENFIYLHHLILNRKPHQYVQFLNGNPLDCRKSNLILVKYKNM